MQAKDQNFFYRANQAMTESFKEVHSICVYRGKKHHVNPPSYGYRYDGLFRILTYWREPDDKGFKICKFLLVSKDKKNVYEELHPYLMQRKEDKNIVYAEINKKL